ncbi:hypothetical protein KIN20_011609 [Parelaphostrongylus tenuis]|uniref:BAR domain-containing protein n=1 Tax=Parelaphostrongylus tenuis TaxID=148309 RepID=A0AAD5MB44_PARTN|nr:hypothetical protein KIN20_011609 [Parelaphostrongylus tenuis]
MDFNFKKIATEAGGFFSRAKQRTTADLLISGRTLNYSGYDEYTEETFLKAERTDLDPHFENLLPRADKTEEHTRRLLSCIEGYLQPNPTSKGWKRFFMRSWS